MTTRNAIIALVSLILLGQAAPTDASRTPTYGAATYHVDVDCLTTRQFDRLEHEFHGARGAVAFDDIDSHCVVEMAPNGAGVSPFDPCENGRLVACAVPAVATVTPSGTEMLSLINPDSMHPECLVGANPTPHP